jgi:hypothetical protein
MKIEVDYWDRLDCFKTNSELVRTEEWEGTEEEIFIKLYEHNNSLRYCNGSYYKIKDKDINKRYMEFHSKYNTIEHYYGGGVVD